ncbi:MAG: hypothetical protein ACLQG3_18555, partial [Terracidiphilus sp.]
MHSPNAQNAGPSTQFGANGAPNFAQRLSFLSRVVAVRVMEKAENDEAVFRLSHNPGGDGEQSSP